MFSVENLTKHYAGIFALNQVSLRFEPGSVTALIGTSGSGKSTLLRLLIRLDRPGFLNLGVDAPALPFVTDH